MTEKGEIVLQEFKAFAFKGNLIDLAVAFILGAAFTSVTTSMVNDLFMPLIGAVVSNESFSNLSVTVGGADVTYGNFMNALVYFLLVALILFVFVRLINRIERPFVDDPAPTTRECPFCLQSIPRLATRCSYCTSDVEPVVTSPA